MPLPLNIFHVDMRWLIESPSLLDDRSGARAAAPTGPEPGGQSKPSGVKGAESMAVGESGTVGDVTDDKALDVRLMARLDVEPQSGSMPKTEAESKPACLGRKERLGEEGNEEDGSERRWR